MKYLIAFCLLTVIPATIISAQSRVYVMGSVHSPTKYITQDTLLKALNTFKPDIILMELDTSLMDARGNFKIDQKKLSLEGQTVHAYKKSYPAVQLGGIDVANRNAFYKEHNTFAKEDRMGKVIDSLYKNNMLNDTTWFIVNSLYSATQVINNFGYLQFKDINSALCMQAASLRQTLLYRKEVEVIRNNSDLRNWYSFAKEDADFWDLRNQTMVKNISSYVKNYPGKNIAVIVGYFHKYALMDGLKRLAPAKQFVLVE